MDPPIQCNAIIPLLRFHFARVALLNSPEELNHNTEPAPAGGPSKYKFEASTERSKGGIPRQTNKNLAMIYVG